MCLMFITQEKMSNHVQFIAIVGEKIQYWAKQNRIIHLKFGTCNAVVDENSRLLGRDTMLATVSLLPPC